MDGDKNICPICNNPDLILRHEASYVYSYVFDSDAPGLKNRDEFFSYKYDNREQKETCEYIECKKCGTKYPYTFLNSILDVNTWK